ncbi:M35 family metallo-endopeptidase [Ekhidna sp. To15]|uniref:M35 family metallo-endopeptidase n=1 Tax=Ekhidna sp. To15 TaxID=3395267 RepID=UPI003F51E5FF
MKDPEIPREEFEKQSEHVTLILAASDALVFAKRSRRMLEDYLSGKISYKKLYSALNRLFKINLISDDKNQIKKDVEIIIANYRSIERKIESQLKFKSGKKECSKNKITMAYVVHVGHIIQETIYVCPKFFLKRYSDARRAATVIHEVSHICFGTIKVISDEVYFWDKAKFTPLSKKRLMANGDAFGYFALFAKFGIKALDKPLSEDVLK